VRSCTTALALALAIAAPAGAAEPSADERADQLLEEGTRLFTEDADYEGARRRFEESYAVRPSWKALNGVALTWQGQGRFIEALQTYERLEAEFGAGLSDGQRATVTRRIGELAARIGVIEIEARQPEALVLLDGKRVGQGPYRGSARVLPGSHLVLGTLAGHQPFTQLVEVGAGETARVQVELQSEKVRLVVEEREARWARRFPRWLPWTVGGAGHALAAAGGLFSLAAASNYDDFDAMVAEAAGDPPAAIPVDEGLRERADVQKTIATSLYVAAGAAVVGGVVLLIANQPYRVGEVVRPAGGPVPGGAVIGVELMF
jgi:hypothetical protein